MGCYVSSPICAKTTNKNDESAVKLSDFDKDDESAVKLGDILSGRLADVDIDSVEAVRDTRERR